MKKQGTVVKWDDARGFGFIRSGAKGDLFFHVRDFRGMNTLQPREGLLVAFDEKAGDKGLRAVAVQPASEANAARGENSRSSSSQRPPSPSHSPKRQGEAAPRSGAAFALPLMAAYSAALVWAVWTRQMPWWVLPALFFINLATFYLYMRDKYAASQRAWRVSEGTLHFWALVGGWPGAWFAQQLLRHKSRKQAFRMMYWLTVVLHCAALGLWLYPR